MELLEAIRIVRNQRKIVLPLMLIAFLAATVMVMQIHTSYRTSGTITLLNSNLQSTDNPYLRFDASLQTTAQVLGSQFTTDQQRAKYDKKGLSADYSVEVPYDPTRTILLPELVVDVNASKPEIADKTRTQILNDIQDELKSKQSAAGAPEETWIQSSAVPDDKVVAVSGSKARTFVIVFGLGTTFAIMVAFIVDGFQKGTKRFPRGATIIFDGPVKEEEESSAIAPVKTAARKRTRTPVKKTSRKKPTTTKTEYSA
jgi:capsular polysaccharide biosynthesis protein